MAFAGNQPNRKNIDFTPQASAPSDAVTGSTIYHSTSGLIFYTGTEWVATSGAGGGASNLDGLSDVNTAGVATEDSLVYNGSSWVPSGVTGGGGASALNDLTDVNTAGLAVNEALIYTGSRWVPSGMDLSTNVVGDLGDLDDVSVAGLANGSGLAYNQGVKSWEVKNFNLGHHTTGNIQDLDNVTVSTPASGQFLLYNGSEWINTPTESLGSVSGYVWKLVDSGSIASQSSIKTPSISADAKRVEFRFTNVDVTADLAWFARGLDSSDTAIGADYSHAQQGAVQGSAFGRATNSGDSRIELMFDDLGDSDTTMDGEGQLTLSFENPSYHKASPSTVDANFKWDTCFLDTIGRVTTIAGHGVYAGSTEIDKIEVFTNQSTFSAGNYEVYELVELDTTIVFTANNLNNLSDVSAASPASGDMLKYNGSNWESYTTEAVQVKKIIQSVDGQSATSDIETLNIDNYSSQNVSRVEWNIFDIDVTADLDFELVAQTYVSDVVTDNTGASDYSWHLDGGGGTGEYGLSDTADDSIILNFNDATRHFDTDTDGRGSIRIIWVNPAEHMANPSTVPAHFQYNVSSINPNGTFQSYYGHGFYYGATGTGDMCTALKVKTSTSTFTCSYNVTVEIEKRL